jgi:glutathione S-transferase
MPIKLHRCPFLFNKLSGHPCWRVQKALDEAGVEYEIVKEPALRWNRTEVERRTGQRALPVLELEDGTWLREESADLAARVREGRLTP